MTLSLAAIFGTNASEPVVVPTAISPEPTGTPTNTTSPPAIPDFAPWPIVEGNEHFSLWVDDPLGPWPEFIPGFHYDVRQPSRLRALLAPLNESLPNRVVRSRMGGNGMKATRTRMSNMRTLGNGSSFLK